MYGMLAAGVDSRAKTYVFIAATPSLSDWAFFGKQPRSKAEYLHQNAILELSDYLRQVKNASTLFQFGTQDIYVSKASTGVLLAAAQPPKERSIRKMGGRLKVSARAEGPRRAADGGRPSSVPGRCRRPSTPMGHTAA